MDKSEVKQDAVKPLTSPFSIKREPGARLPSFKPPRDLSLGPSSASTIKNLINPALRGNKKLFTPNINVVRKKTQSEHVAETKPVIPDPKNSRERKKNNNQRKNTSYVQTQGVFSEGLAPSLKPTTSSYSGGEATSKPSMEKPKLNLKKTIIKSSEDSKMNDLMRDDFIDDPKSLPDLSNIPYTLPRVYGVKKEGYKKDDIDSTFASIQIKPENFKQEKKEDPTEEILHLFESTQQPKLFIFEFPPMVSKEEPEEKKRPRHQEPVDQNPVKKGMFNGLSEGLWGSLNIYANGRTYLMLNDRKIPVTVIRHSTRQDLVSSLLDTGKSTGEIINLGTIYANFTCSTVFERNPVKSLVT